MIKVYYIKYRGKIWGKILITGASGNVGQYVAKYALQNGDNVIVAARNIEKLTLLFGQEVNKVKFDFADTTTFEPALENVDRVFLMRPPYMGDYHDLIPFIEAVKQHHIKLICFLSLMGIEHNPIPPHYKIEKEIKHLHIPYSFIRPSFFKQNISGVHALEIKNFNRIIVPVGNALTSFIDTEDIGKFSARILHEPMNFQNTAYEITGPEAIGYNKVAKIMSEELHRSIIYPKLNSRVVQRYWTEIRGLDKKYVKVMGMLYFMTRRGLAKRTSSTYYQVMGEEPTNFRQFVKKHLRSWQ